MGKGVVAGTEHCDEDGSLQSLFCFWSRIVQSVRQSQRASFHRPVSLPQWAASAATRSKVHKVAVAITIRCWFLYSSHKSCRVTLLRFNSCDPFHIGQVPSPGFFGNRVKFGCEGFSSMSSGKGQEIPAFSLARSTETVLGDAFTLWQSGGY